MTSPRAPRAAPPVRGSHCSAGCTGCAGAGLVLPRSPSPCPPLRLVLTRGPALALSTLRFSGAGHHEQTEGATGDSQRGNHRHAHRLAPRRGPLAFFFPPTPLPSLPFLRFRQASEWDRPLAACSLPCGFSFRPGSRWLIVSTAGDSCVTAWAAFGLARVVVVVVVMVSVTSFKRLLRPLLGNSAVVCFFRGSCSPESLTAFQNSPTLRRT